MSAETAEKTRIGVRCPGCATTLRIPHNLLSQKKVRCPKCGGQVSAQGPKTLVIAIGADQTGLDPQTVQNNESGFIMATMYDSIVSEP